jgi:alkylation response protein AidB-like acyl-CoA dehydrogenase
MDFTFTEEQAIFRDSVARTLAARYPFERRQTLIAGEPGFDEADWQGYAEQGWLALPFAEAHGGLGAGPVETMLLMEQFGRHLVAAPYLASVVLGGGLVQTAGSEAQRAELLPGLCEGRLRLAFAFAEPRGRYDLGDLMTRARPDGAGFVLDGHKSLVLYASAADRLVVSARTAGAAPDREGITLLLVDPSAPGVELQPYRTHDGGRAAEVRFEAVVLGRDAVLGEVDAALPQIEQVADQAIAALCAEAVGAMWAVHERTLDYAKTRRQFGQALGSFQVIQHRLVDLYMKCQLAQSMVYHATAALSAEPGRRAAGAAAAKYQVGGYARDVAQEGIQLHGGIGMTRELPIGHYLKRVTAINATLGDPRHHLRRYTRLNGGSER